MMSRIKKVAFYLLVVMLFLLPFHAFGSVFLNYGYGLADVFGSAAIISMWKEFILILLTLLLGVKYFFKKQLPQLDLIDHLILGYIFFGIFHGIFLKLDTSQFIWGARYDYLFLWAFLVVRHFRFTTEEMGTLFRSVIFGGLTSLVLGYVIHYLIRPENLTMFGFRNDWSTWYPGQSLAFCQRIENQELCRMSGTFAGPNQLGAYLTLLLPLIYMWRKEIMQKITAPSVVRAIPAVMFLVALYALFLTYSRGAYIGIFVALIILLTYEFKLLKHVKYVLLGGLTFGMIAVLILLLTTDLTNLIRPESTGEHLAAWIMGLQEMAAHPPGQGLGSAGPASYRTATPIIPESWYLQVGIELGFIGLGLFLAILIIMIKALFQKISEHHKKPHIYVLSGFLGVLAIALFLHTLEDSAVSLTLFSLLGLVLAEIE